VTGGQYDILIVGAGAAGCAAAISLPTGARAILIDRGDPASPGQAPTAGRCCGGLLAPDAQRALRRLGLDLPEKVRVRPEPKAVRVRDLDTNLAQRYARDYRNVDRAEFDSWLLNLASERAEFRPHTRLDGLVRTATGVEVRLTSAGGRAETVHAALAIGADGALSATRRVAFPDRPGPPAMLAIQARLESARPPDDHEVLFARHLTDFYAWAIPKAGSVLVGAAFGDVRAAKARFEKVLEAMRREFGLEGRVIERCARHLGRPHTGRQLFGGVGRVLLVGEAAGLVSPSSGEGLSFALETGLAAGRAAGESAPAGAYLAAFRHQARRVRRKFIKARVIFSPPCRRWALRIPWCP
jgi:flavin-dependent dehydrogenase